MNHDLSDKIFYAHSILFIINLYMKNLVSKVTVNYFLYSTISTCSSLAIPIVNACCNANAHNVSINFDSNTLGIRISMNTCLYTYSYVGKCKRRCFGGWMKYISFGGVHRCIL